MPLQDRINRIGENLWSEEFLKEHGIEVKTEKGYYMANYGHTTRSDRYADLCRGTIFYPNGRLACLPLARFFNVHEGSAANIDWRTALVSEKLDGTMIVAWHDSEWHLSTKKMIDYLPVTRFGSTERIDLAKKFREYFEHYQKCLDHRYWYVFELVCPENRIVTKYEDGRCGLYLLAMRHSQTLQEVSSRNVEQVAKDFGSERVRSPKLYNLVDYNDPNRTLDRVSSLLKDWRDDEEGVVVVDSKFNRVKIKKKSYVRLHHVISNVSSMRNVIDLILNGESYEVLSYFPEAKSLFESVEKKLNMLKEDIMTTFGKYNSLETQKEFALAVKDLPYARFLFRLRKGEDLSYQFQQMGGKRLEGFIEERK